MKRVILAFVLLILVAAGCVLSIMTEKQTTDYLIEMTDKIEEAFQDEDFEKALTLTETLTAVFFVMEHIRKAGYELSTMGEAAKKFIANWESEKYRKSLAGKKA